MAHLNDSSSRRCSTRGHASGSSSSRSSNMTRELPRGPPSTLTRGLNCFDAPRQNFRLKRDREVGLEEFDLGDGSQTHLQPPADGWRGAERRIDHVDRPRRFVGRRGRGLSGVGPRAAYADNPAQCPLSADEDDPTCSLIHFAQGSLEVVHDDLRRVFAPCTTQGGDRYSARRRHRRRLRGQARTRELQEDMPEHPALCHAAGPRFTTTRRTLFKGSDDERIDIDDERIYVHSDRHTALCDALSPGKKGGSRCHVRLRQFVKTVCCVSRHPAKATPEYLATPRSLKHLRKYVRCAGDTVASQRGHTTVDEVHEADGDDDGADLHRGEESGAAHLARAMDGFAHLGWPPRIVSFVRKSLVAKGAVKALWMHSELIRGLRHLETYLRLLRGCVTGSWKPRPNLVDALSASRLEGVHGGDASSILQRVSRACVACERS